MSENVNEKPKRTMDDHLRLVDRLQLQGVESKLDRAREYKEAAERVFAHAVAEVRDLERVRTHMLKRLEDNAALASVISAFAARSEGEPE